MGSRSIQCRTGDAYGQPWYVKAFVCCDPILSRPISHESLKYLEAPAEVGGWRNWEHHEGVLQMGLSEIGL